MNRKSKNYWCIASICLLAGGAYAGAQSGRTTPPANAVPVKTPVQAAALKQLPRYKQWTRATKKPVLELSRFAMLCAGPPMAQVKQEATNPHNDKYIVVYVNDKGKHALLHEEKPSYPVGTLIVKEKRAKPNSATPELCTVMLKREAGYDPHGGDWQYFVTDGTGTRFQNNGNAAHCKSCHAEQKPVDYVFRRYLPDIAYRYYERRAQETKPAKL